MKTKRMDEIDFERESIQMEQMIPTVFNLAGIGYLITICLLLIFGEENRIFLIIPICIMIPLGVLYIIISTNRKLRQYELEQKKM